MKRLGVIITRTSTIFIILLALILAGCASQTDETTNRQFDDNYRFVPRVHVEDNSFGVTGGGDYWGCSYDQLYEGYWCPVR